MIPTEPQVIPKAALLAGLTQLLAVGGPFNALTLMLFKNDFTIDSDTLLADLVVADFGGYANVAGVTFSAAYYDVDGTAIALGADEAFICSGTPFDNVIYGYALVNVGVTLLRSAYKFVTPVAIDIVGAGVAVAPFLRYSGN